MTEHGMTRAEVSIDDVTVLLAEDEDIGELKKQIEAAARSPGRFVDFIARGGRAISALITSRTRVIISVTTAAAAAEMEPPHMVEWDL